MSSTAGIPTIELTQDETRLVHLLTDCADWVDQRPDLVNALRLKDEHGEWIGRERTKDPVELRIAGGWVRDKVSLAAFHFALVRAPNSSLSSVER